MAIDLSGYSDRSCVERLFSYMCGLLCESDIVQALVWHVVPFSTKGARKGIPSLVISIASRIILVLFCIKVSITLVFVAAICWVKSN